jgi:hypothetical protein
MESASDRLKPVTRGIGVYDGGEAVTDVKTVGFESASGSLDEGKHRVTLTWKDGIYLKKKPYRSRDGRRAPKCGSRNRQAFTDDF